MPLTVGQTRVRFIAKLATITDFLPNKILPWAAHGGGSGGSGAACVLGNVVRDEDLLLLVKKMGTLIDGETLWMISS